MGFVDMISEFVYSIELLVALRTSVVMQRDVLRNAGG